MKHFVFLFIAISLFADCAAQTSLAPYHSKWQLKQAFGYNFPSTRLLKEEITDYLVDYGESGVYWQPLSGTHFFSKHWGIEFSFRLNHSKNTTKRTDRFISEMTSAYPDYYPQIITSSMYDHSSIVDGDIQTGTLGCIYRFETERLFIYPKLAIGVTSFFSDYGIASLKEKNTNNVIQVAYAPEDALGSTPNDFFTVATSSAMGYKLSKRFYVNADVSLSWYRANFGFIKSVSNRYTGQRTEETITYRKHLFNVSSGAGIIFVIR